MENLSLHIEYLLLQHDCVIVPGLGAFLNIYQPPMINELTGTITPPRTEIRFNSALRSDDGLLANSYARKYQTDYRRGSEILMKEVSVLGSSLLSDGEATIGRLGIIYREEEGNLRFVPRKNVWKATEDLGLIEVSLPRIEKQPESEIQDLRANQERIDSSQSFIDKDSLSQEHLSSSTLKSDNYEKRRRKLNFEKNYYIPVNKVFTKVCACLMVVAIFAVAFINNPHTDNPREEKASVLPIDKVLDTAVQVCSKSEEMKTKEDSIALLSNSSETPKEREKDPKYYLVVATCTTMQEADKYVKSHSNKGYELEIIPSSKYYRVSAMSANSRESLVDTMGSAEFKKDFNKAWVLKQ